MWGLRFDFLSFAMRRLWVRSHLVHHLFKGYLCVGSLRGVVRQNDFAGEEPKNQRHPDPRLLLKLLPFGVSTLRRLFSDEPSKKPRFPRILPPGVHLMHDWKAHHIIFDRDFHRFFLWLARESADFHPQPLP